MKLSDVWSDFTIFAYIINSDQTKDGSNYAEMAMTLEYDVRDMML